MYERIFGPMGRTMADEEDSGCCGVEVGHCRDDIAGRGSGEFNGFIGRSPEV